MYVFRIFLCNFVFNSFLTFLVLGKFCLYTSTSTKFSQKDYKRKPFKNKCNIPIIRICRYDNKLIKNLLQWMFNVVVFKTEIFCSNNVLDYLYKLWLCHQLIITENEEDQTSLLWYHRKMQSSMLLIIFLLTFLRAKFLFSIFRILWSCFM